MHVCAVGKRLKEGLPVHAEARVKEGKVVTLMRWEAGQARTGGPEEFLILGGKS
jgi:hypothetical protein